MIHLYVCTNSNQNTIKEKIMSNHTWAGCCVARYFHCTCPDANFTMARLHPFWSSFCPSTFPAWSGARPNSPWGPFTINGHDYIYRCQWFLLSRLRYEFVLMKFIIFNEHVCVTWTNVRVASYRMQCLARTLPTLGGLAYRSTRTLAWLATSWPTTDAASCFQPTTACNWAGIERRPMIPLAICFIVKIDV